MRPSKEALKRFGTASVKLLARAAYGLISLAGLAGIGYGTWLIYQPAAYIVVGILLIVATLPEKSPTK